MSELRKRGQSPFDDAALIQALAALPLDEGTWFEIEPALFEQYNAYYSLDFEAVAKRTFGIFAVRQDRIFSQTFVPKSQKPVAWALVCHGYYDCLLYTSPSPRD